MSALRQIYVVARDVPHRKRRPELWVPIDRLLHRKLVQLMCKEDGAGFVELSRVQFPDELLIVAINISFGDAVLAE